MTSHRAGLLLTAALSILIAACGSTTPTPAPASPSAVASGVPVVLPVAASSEFRVGENRTVFSLLDPTGQKPVATPDRTLSIGYRGPSGETIAPMPQTFIWAIEGASGVYVGHAAFPTPGKWTADIMTEAPGSPKATIPYSFDVQARASVVSPGDPAPSVKTPTLADVGGNVAKVSTDAKPVSRFYETSEDAALVARTPFVLIFATPKFCQSATCGPTLDKLKPIAAAHPELTFINVEPYQLMDVEGQLQPVLNDGNLVPVEATTAFKLRTEPYVFVVGSDGKVSASFELVFSPEEIEAAIAAVESAG